MESSQYVSDECAGALFCRQGTLLQVRPVIMQDENWDDLRVFQAVAHSGQIASAAKILRIDPTTISRRLRRLERSLGHRLVEQAREGQVLTELGEGLLVQVERMAEEAASVFNTADNRPGLSGQIRVSVSEGFGSWFLASRLPDLIKDYPALRVELVASSGFLSPSKREADIAVMLSRPKAGPLIARKLSDYSLMLYASTAYLTEKGMPSQPADLAGDHRLVGYISDLLYAPELDYLNEVYPNLQATVRSSSINAQLQLIERGAGIGVLPCFMGDQNTHLRRILPDVRIARSFWIVTHQDTHRLAKVQCFNNWMVEQVQEHTALLLPPSQT